MFEFDISCLFLFRLACIFILLNVGFEGWWVGCWSRWLRFVVMMFLDMFGVCFYWVCSVRLSLVLTLCWSGVCEKMCSIL